MSEFDLERARKLIDVARDRLVWDYMGEHPDIDVWDKIEAAVGLLAKIMAGGDGLRGAAYVRLGENELGIDVIVELDDTEVALMERLQPRQP